MVFATYTYDRFPVVHVAFGPDVESDAEFDSFLAEWLVLHRGDQDFEFVFDTCQMGMVSVVYCLKLALFIRELKRAERQRLRRSVILVKDDYIQKLLDLMFCIQKPVAPVYILQTDETDVGTLEELWVRVASNPRATVVWPSGWFQEEDGSA